MTTELRRIQVRRGTASDWSTLNPVLAQGEPGFAHDTGVLKIGDGSTAWNSLPVVNISNEAIDDRVAALLVAGSNITLTYNDVSNTLTIASTGGGGGGSSTVSKATLGLPLFL